MIEWAGRTALVTGGASGIGAASCRRLSALGATVFVGDLDGVGGEKVAAATGGHYVPLDVTDAASWADALEVVTRGHEGLDVLHLNAGIMARPRGAPMSDDPLPWLSSRYEAVRSVNVDGVVIGTMSSLDHLAAVGGRVVVTASVAGFAAMPQDPAYALTKHAVVGFVRSLGPTLADRGMKINAVCPGGVNTDLVPPDVREERAGRLMDPAVIADAVVVALESSGSGEIWVMTGADDEPWIYEFPAPR